MTRIKQFLPLFLGFVLVMIIISACGPGSSNTQSTLTPLQVIQNSANAIKNLKTEHNTINATIEVSGMVLSTDGKSNVTVTMQGSGDQSIADKQQTLDLTMNLNSTSTHVSEVITSDKIYIKTDQGSWYALDTTAFAQFGSAGGLSSIDEKSLLALILDSKLTDHGDENLNGQSLRHITVDMDQATFTKLVADNPQLKSSLGSQGSSDIFNNLQNFVASVDVYIDETQFHVHRTHLKVSFTANINNTTANMSMDMTIDMSKFNDPVTITIPTDVQPLPGSNQTSSTSGQ